MKCDKLGPLLDAGDRAHAGTREDARCTAIARMGATVGNLELTHRLIDDESVGIDQACSEFEDATRDPEALANLAAVWSAVRRKKKVAA